MAKRTYDWNAVQAYYDAGHGFVQCSKRFGFTHAAWIKAMRRGSLRLEPSPFRDRRRRYTWSDVQAFYDKAHTYRETAAVFGFCSAAWFKAIERGEIKNRAAVMPIAQLLASRKRNRTHIKLRLLKDGLLENRCQSCGLSEWRGQPLSMHLDHINGVRNDNRLENLRMLCPNCHSQTPTYSGRNARLRRLQESAPPV